MSRSPLAISGLLLAATTVVGMVLWVVPYGGLGSVSDDDFGFGFAGAIAAALAWAAHAPTALRGAVRAALGAAALALVAMGIVAFALSVALPLDTDLPIETYEVVQDDDASGLVSDVLALGGSGTIAAAIAAAFGAVLGAAAQRYAALPRQRLVRLVPAAVVFSPFVFEATFATTDGIGLELTVCIVAAVWLGGAMRHARDARQAARRNAERVAGAPQAAA